jgi:hypothetical protein
VLCDCQIALVIFNSNNKLFQYSSGDIDAILKRFQGDTIGPHEKRSNKDVSLTHDVPPATLNPSSPHFLPPLSRGQYLKYNWCVDFWILDWFLDQLGDISRTTLTTRTTVPLPSSLLPCCPLLLRTSFRF